MLEWADGLKLRGDDLYFDSRRPRQRCFISHAHSDHLGLHEESIATPATAMIAQHRMGPGRYQQLEYGEELDFSARTRVRLLSAGHVRGSAMIHVTSSDGTLLYTGDFKLRTSLTAAPATPAPADVLVMESTYGLEPFRFPPWQSVAAQLVDLVESAFCAGRQPIVLGYSLGKSQEITRILSDAGFIVTAHGSVFSMNTIYERLGGNVGSFRRYSPEDFHGPGALDLRERGVLVAPPMVARTPFCERFENPCRIIMAGWALLKNAIYRYGVEHALPLSDHADFGELVELIEQVQPKKIFCHHGYREFVDTLRSRGLDATLARPDAQLQLFD